MSAFSPYQRLAAAIILQAVSDRKRATYRAEVDLFLQSE